jgi:hypothetical protein
MSQQAPILNGMYLGMAQTELARAAPACGQARLRITLREPLSFGLDLSHRLRRPAVSDLDQTASGSPGTVRHDSRHQEALRPIACIEDVESRCS